MPRVSRTRLTAIHFAGAYALLLIPGLQGQVIADRSAQEAQVVEWMQSAEYSRIVAGAGLGGVLEDRRPLSHWYGLSLVWMVFDPAEITVGVRDVRRFGRSSDIFPAVAEPGDLVVINGGFFRRGGNDEFEPLGLVVSESAERNPLAAFSTGGIAAWKGERLTITPIGVYSPDPTDREAIQSTPIIIWADTVDVRATSADRFNRTAIARTDSNEIVIVGAFMPSGRAMTVFEFATALMSLPLRGGPRVREGLAMDAGPGAHVYVPETGSHFGNRGPTYVPNVIAVANSRRDHE